ncbi:MAG: hypothetical protein M1118_13770 [Chloroflexi bacterium]|nr:hypothetical protein [Chloroflexota bacterium]
MKRVGVWLVTLLAPFALLLGCGPDAAAPPQFVAASREKAYHSSQQLNDDAIGVVLVTATSTRSVEQIGTVPYTVSVVKVDQALRGAIDGPRIELRQMGSSGGNLRIADAAPLVQAGNSYVVFLQRFTYGPGKDTDQYIPVGGSPGLFLGQGGTLKRLDPLSPDLPAAITLTDLQHQIAR